MRKIVAEKLRNGVQERCTMLGLSLAILAQSIGRDTTTLRAWLRGVNRVTLDDALLLDSYFAKQGLPGLLEELRPNTGHGGVWHAEELPISAMPKHLGGIVEALRAGVGAGALTTFLSEKGMLDQVHILLHVDDAVMPLHMGTKVPVKFGPDVFGRDIRQLSDPALGAMIYRQIRELFQRDRPSLHRLSSAPLTYRRLAVPVGQRFVASFPYDIEAKGAVIFD